MTQNTKLELTWIGKYDEKPNVEPRILIENPHYSYGSIETGVLPRKNTFEGRKLTSEPKFVQKRRQYADNQDNCKGVSTFEKEIPEKC